MSHIFGKPDPEVVSNKVNFLKPGLTLTIDNLAGVSKLFGQIIIIESIIYFLQ